MKKPETTRKPDTLVDGEELRAYAEQLTAAPPVVPAPVPSPAPAHEADHWSADNLPPGWDTWRDEAQAAALDAANLAYTGGADEATAITAGAIAAKSWATAHGVSVRK